MKILGMGDSPHTISGFGTASRNLFTHLHNQGHEVAYIGWQTFGQEQVASFHRDVLGYRLLPNIGGKQFGDDAWKFWINQFEPDIFITLADFWMLMDIFRNDIPYPWCMWYPIDGYPITDQMHEMLKRIDYRVCISEYGANMVREHGFDSAVIPHGCNTKVFKRYPTQAIKEMKSKLGIPENAFVVGDVNRNQSRKMIPRLMQSFVPFHKDFPDSILLLWMDKRDPEGWDLEYIAKQLNLKEGKDIIFPPPELMMNFMYGAPEEDLALVYNAINIHGFPTGGEGFGLTLLEAMACGSVNVATDYTTSSEILGNYTCGLPAKVKEFDYGNAGVHRALVDIEDMYAKMKWLRENPDEMLNMSNRGIERAKKVYDWSIIVKNFDKYLRDNVQ